MSHILKIILSSLIRDIVILQNINGTQEAPYATILVGKDNFYKPYDVAVQAANEKGMGPMSDVVTIRSAMRST